MTPGQEERLFKTLGHVDEFMENFRDRVLPGLMTTNGCRTKHAELGVAEGDLRDAIRAARLAGRGAWLKVIAAVALASLLSNGAVAEMVKALLR